MLLHIKELFTKVFDLDIHIQANEDNVIVTVM